MKRYYVLILCLLVGLTFVSCNSKGMTKPPEISITAGDKEIVYIVGLNQWNGAVYDREDTFHTIMKWDSGIEVPYIRLGETIQIVIKGTVPDKFQLKDYVLLANGDVKYSEKLANEIPIKFIDGKATFELETHIASMLSSDSKDYEPGKTNRGFRLDCSWGENKCEYGFIIRTDAIKAGL